MLAHLYQFALGMTFEKNFCNKSGHFEKFFYPLFYFFFFSLLSIKMALTVPSMVKSTILRMPALL